MSGMFSESIVVIDHLPLAGGGGEGSRKYMKTYMFFCV